MAPWSRTSGGCCQRAQFSVSPPLPNFRLVSKRTRTTSDFPPRRLPRVLRIAQLDGAESYAPSAYSASLTLKDIEELSQIFEVRPSCEVKAVPRRLLARASVHRIVKRLKKPFSSRSIARRRKASNQQQSLALEKTQSSFDPTSIHIPDPLRLVSRGAYDDDAELAMTPALVPIASAADLRSAFVYQDLSSLEALPSLLITYRPTSLSTSDGDIEVEAEASQW
ncbi:hypothetical protein MRB53_038623 [Persea americana]|nr:hypothetical protein MRB53_038623 [Persea americana]